MSMSNVPNLLPSDQHTARIGDDGGSSTPEVTDEMLAQLTASVPTAPEPSLAPPAEAAAAEQAGAEGAAALTWRTNVRIDGLWAINETRNAFVHVQNVGWRKIYNGRDGSFLALVLLASHARQANRLVTLGEETDGMVHRMYVW